MMNKQYHDELEGLLSESADDLRMYPSDRVWRNINKELHGDKQWPALNFGAVFTGALVLAALLFFQPDKDLFTIKPLTAAQQKTAPAARAAAFKVAGRQIEPAYENTHQAIIHAPHAMATSDNSEPASLVDTSNLMDASTTAAASTVESANVITQTGIPQSDVALTTAEEWQPLSLSTLTAGESIVTGSSINSISPKEERNDTPGIFPELTTAQNSPVLAAAVQKMAAKKGRWSVQYYATPSFSYRLLSEEKSQLANMLTPATSITLGSMVQHRPKTGVEAGASFAYRITENLKVKVGLQANYRRYAIEAYNTTTRQPAVLMMDQGLRVDTLMMMTDVSTVANGRPIEMSNQLMQLSAPIGFELRMAEFKNTRFIVAATIQPTYNIGQQSWLISADYRNYVKQPSLLRKWNINTGIEAFMQFNGKKGISWQVGPQIRYQLLPGAVRSYPVREHLIDYGVKIGVSKTL